MSELAYITCTDAGYSGMPLGAAWGSEPGGRSWVPGYRKSYCHKYLGRGMLEDSLRCHYFARVKFSCVAIYMCYSTRFLQLTGTVPFLMCYTVYNVLSNTTWYWGETSLGIVFNNMANGPEWNG